MSFVASCLFLFKFFLLVMVRNFFFEFLEIFALTIWGLIHFPLNGAVAVHIVIVLC